MGRGTSARRTSGRSRSAGRRGRCSPPTATASSTSTTSGARPSTPPPPRSAGSSTSAGSRWSASPSATSTAPCAARRWSATASGVACAAASACPPRSSSRTPRGKSVYPVFTADAGTGIEGLGGAGDIVLVPDPKSFRVLPWAPNTGWVLCDLHFPDGRPVPFSTRRIFRDALDRLAARGYGVTIGVEIEFHVFRATGDGGLEDEHVAAPGRPGEAPAVRPVSRGAQLLREEDLDALDDLVQALSSGLLALDLPLRSLELEFGPSQLELTMAPRPGLQAADDVVLARTAIRQICRRHGYLATFMSRPAGADTASAGWHLHQSLVDLRERRERLHPDRGRGRRAALLDRAALPRRAAPPRPRGRRLHHPDRQRLQALPPLHAGARPDLLGHRQQGRDGARGRRPGRPGDAAGEPLRRARRQSLPLHGVPDHQRHGGDRRRARPGRADRGPLRGRRAARCRRA